jgi:hypothetical protein
MVKTFYTERDIEDIARRGEMTLLVGEDVVLTELAYEKAERLGVKLLQPNQLPPSAPIRPYLSQPVPAMNLCAQCSDLPVSSDEDDELRQRIRDAVKAKLGNQIDSALLETIITRVLNNVGVK